ncbi:MAG TPA: MraY family glycosyltransferase [Bryobacteraceae bacterium]|nr:MraY family glycosyltransferase [Bryobacteraceae bacterium]
MTPLILLAVLSFAVSLFLVPLCRNAALRWKLVDYPDLTRKIHRRPIPRIGGVPLAASAAIASLAAWLIATLHGSWPAETFRVLGMMAVPALAALLLGLFDDLAGMKASHKLAGQAVVALTAVGIGIRIQAVAGISLGPWAGGLVTVLWLVACANAMNLIDGVDGLASGVALVAAGASMAAAILSGHPELALAFAPIIGGLAGFLVFNFNPASIFLGDCGSLMLGILLGCYGVLLSNEPGISKGMLAPLILLSVPLADVSLAMTRRFLRRQPIFSADRSHIHHRLLALGLTPRRVMMALCGAEAVASLIALVMALTSHGWDAAILAVFVCAGVLCIGKLEYAEFDAVRGFFRDDAFRLAVSGHVAVRQFEDIVSEATTPQECWRAVEATSKMLGVHRAEMRIGGAAFRYHINSPAIRSWQIYVPISELDWVEFYQDPGPPGKGHATAMIAFAETIRRLLASKSFISPRPARHGALISSSIASNKENLARAAAGSQGQSN